MESGPDCWIWKSTISIIYGIVYLLRGPPRIFLVVVFVEAFFLPKEPEMFFANQSEMSGKSFDWLNMFIDDCISYNQK